MSHPSFRWSLLAAGSVLVSWLAAACASARYSSEPGAPTLVLPAHFAEGEGEPASSAEAAPSASAHASSPSAAAPAAASSAGSSEVPLAPSTLPDPPPLRLAAQVQYELELRDGKVSVLSVTPVKLAQPVVTPRRLGRYAIELSIGGELIDRLRFDFPGTAADDPPNGARKPLDAPLTLSAHAIGHLKLLVPQSPRVRRAVLVDRALGTVTELEWPLPDVPRAAPAASAAAGTPQR